MGIWADWTARWVPFRISIYKDFISEDKTWRCVDDEPVAGISAVVAGAAAAAAGF